MNVLIVDDSKAMRCIIARALREMGVPGSPYLEAANGQAALNTIASADPDLVISDLNMPEMTGMQLLRILRQDGNATPFGFVTAEASAELRQEAADAGARFVVTKPFTPANLSQALGPVLAALGCETMTVDDALGKASFDTNSAFPKPAQIALALTELLRRRVEVKLNPAPIPPNMRIVAEYRSLENEALVACAVCSVSFAARSGAALTLIPASGAEEAIRERLIDDVLAENFNEVLNVTTRLFHQAGNSRIHLAAIHKPDTCLGVELAMQIAKPASRLDLGVEIAGYGDGRLSLLSGKAAK
jgi:two-component system, chemotaxis family, chemotaxis protein CheY